jgi:hypothetical protein
LPRYFHIDILPHAPYSPLEVSGTLAQNEDVTGLSHHRGYIGQSAVRRRAQRDGLTAEALGGEGYNPMNAPPHTRSHTRSGAQRATASRIAAGADRGTDRCDRAHLRRDRHRKGADRAGDSSAQTAPPACLREAELPAHSHRTLRRRAPRTQQGRVYGSRGDADHPRAVLRAFAPGKDPPLDHAVVALSYALDAGG